MDSSKLRQRLLRLDKERRNLISEVLRPLPMIIGSLYEIRRRCGRPRCRCTRGELHASWDLSRRLGERTKLSYIGRLIPDWVQEQVIRYQRYQKTLSLIRKIDAEVSDGLKRLRDEKLRDYDRVKKQRS
jgi:hypothetical protein